MLTPNELMKANVKGLLSLREKTPEDLAKFCHNTKSWIVKIFAEERREFPTKYYQRIAKFLGVEVYQLFQPGVLGIAERRSGTDRRKVLDRRVSQAVISEKALDVDLIHVVRALSQPGRQRAIGILMDILNDELAGLRRPRATPSDPADPGHIAETPKSTRAHHRSAR